MLTKEQKRYQRLIYKAKNPDKAKASEKRRRKRKAQENIANGLTARGKPRKPKDSAYKTKLEEQKRRGRIKKILSILKVHIKNLKRKEREEKAKNKLSPEKYRKQWLAAHPNYMENYRKEWKEKNPTYSQDHYQANKEERKKNVKEYEKKNPDKIRGYRRKRSKNPKHRATLSARRRLKDFLGTKLGVKFSAHFGCNKNELLAHLESLFGDKLPELWPENLPFSKYDLSLHQPWEAPETIITCYI